MKDLMEQVIKNRNEIRKSKGLAPVEETRSPLPKKEPTAKSSIVHNGLSQPGHRTIPDVLTAEPLETPPLRDDEYTIPNHRNWQLTMIALTPLEAIYEWAEATRPGSLEKFSD